jgi:lipopolysaccharide/colanic/teichoic acid biosynthesis glycosyltransferase
MHNLFLKNVSLTLFIVSYAQTGILFNRFYAILVEKQKNQLTPKYKCARIMLSERSISICKKGEIALYQPNLAEAELRREKINIKSRPLSEMINKRKLFYAFKRIFDFIASLVAIILLSPLLLLISLLIFIDDPHGSPIFVQDRVGKNGKIFRFYKFRSMVVNAEELLEGLREQNEKDGPVFKIKNDPRITRVGKFLRRTSLDELPQFFNVLKGDMSFVGPRPALPNEVEQYNLYHRQRLLVKPGLTCYWQASKNRDDISFNEWMLSDLRYIKNQCALLDLKLIFKTFFSVFTCQGN